MESQSIQEVVAFTASPSVQEVIVLVGDVVENKIGTISRLLTPMVAAAAPFYEKLYHLQEEKEIKIIFKFSPATAVNEEERIDENTEKCSESQVQPKKLQGEVSVLCSHTHPYLDKKVWLETKGLLDTTYLKGNRFLLVLMYGSLQHMTD